MKKLFLILLILFFASPCFAATYYLSMNGNGSENGSNCANSYDLAWYHSNAASTDIVYLCGEYGSFDGMNTPASNITHEVASGETVTFDSGASGAAITVDEDNCVFKLGSGTAFNITGDAGTAVLIDGSSGDYASGTVFDGFTLDNVGYGTGYPDGVYADGFKLTCADSVTLINGYFGDVTHSAIITTYCDDNHAYKTYVEGNVFENMWRYDMNFYVTGSDEPSDFFYDGNIFKNQGTAVNPYPSTKCGQVFEIGGITRLTIRQNVIYNFNCGIILGAAAHSTSKVAFLHNTFYKAHYTCTGASKSMDSGFHLWSNIYGAGTLSYFDVINNIFSTQARETGKSLWYFGPGDGDNNPTNSRIESNYWHCENDGTLGARIHNWKYNSPDEWRYATWWEDNQNSPAQFIDGTNTVNIDPAFVNTTTYDLSLTSGSSCVNDGIFLSTITGKDGNTITIGDYESHYFFSKENYGITYSGVSSDTIYTDTPGVSATLTAIPAHNQLTLNDASNFNIGDKITFVNWSGSAPDVGYDEYPETSVPTISGLNLY